MCHIKVNTEKMEKCTLIYKHNTRKKLNLNISFSRREVLKTSRANLEIPLSNKLPNKMRKLGEKLFNPYPANVENMVSF
jgi:hypothetical protein